MSSIFRAPIRALFSLLGAFNPFRAPEPKPKLIAADPMLLKWYNLAIGPKPYPDYTANLPARTLLLDQTNSNEILWAQSHAFYEEIDTIDDADVKDGCAPLAHWHVVHPLAENDVKELSMDTLSKLRDWIENTHEFYIGSDSQIGAFRAARWHTLELVENEMVRKWKMGGKKRTIGEGWEDVDESETVNKWTMGGNTRTLEDSWEDVEESETDEA